MKICRYQETADGPIRLGVVRGDKVHDVTAVTEALPSVRWPYPAGDQFIAHLDALRPRMEALADAAVLPVSARLRRPVDFKATLKRGVRVGRPTVVLHATAIAGPPSRAGFVVSKSVGNAVTRNRVKRRLRHLMASRLDHDAPAMDVVVRALPPAASGPLADDLASAWVACVDRLSR